MILWYKQVVNFVEYIIKNSEIRAVINSNGAELLSLKHDEIEYMWQGGEAWRRTSPVLFPVVGRCMNDILRINDVDYPMCQHGFAKDCNFNVYNQTENSITLKLDCDGTNFYKCSLEIHYSLVGKSLITKYKVINKSTGKMYFNIGGHPGFRCPINENEKFEDYILKFNVDEKLVSRDVHVNGNILADEFTEIPSVNGEVYLNRKLFDVDAMIFEHLKSDIVELIHSKNRNGIRFNFSEFPYLAVWTMPQENAKYVCLEPWHGMAYRLDETTEIESKRGIISINEKEEFNIGWSVEILE